MSSLLPLTTTFSTPAPSTNIPSISQRAFTNRTNHTHGFRVSCNGAPNGHSHDDKKLILPETQNLILPNVDRRNLLVGLSGLYTAAKLPKAIAEPITVADIMSEDKPITVPDISPACKDADSGFTPGTIRTSKCCPPYLKKTIRDFVFPKPEEVRMRWPAHAGTPEQVDNYRRAIQAMRDLPADHPHSFSSQAKIHCAYCNGGYSEVATGFPTVDIQIHNSWLFFPFHRWYLYFYERILGKLIGDPAFALPYWKWDEAEGMPIPDMFLEPDTTDGKLNPLYDDFRNPLHVKEKRLVDLDWNGKEKKLPIDEQIACNLSTVYRDLVRNGHSTKLFFGGKYKAGDSPYKSNDPSVGSVERGTHTAVHRWVGDPNMPNHEDLGNFYSAGYDPLFYVHHANVDRMWKLWKELTPRNEEPTDPLWLDASYVFYDENEDLVRVYNKDCINMEKLNYNFIDNSSFQWRKSRPLKRSKSDQIEALEAVEAVNRIRFPLPLDRKLKIGVPRPPRAGVAGVQEELVISRIRYDTGVFVRFDVYVNDKLRLGKVTTPCDPEYAGAFTQIPHGTMNMKMFSYGSVSFGLDQLFEDTNTKDEEMATVTLVPIAGCNDLAIGEIKIELCPA